MSFQKGLSLLLLFISYSNENEFQGDNLEAMVRVSKIVC